MNTKTLHLVSLILVGALIISAIGYVYVNSPDTTYTYEIKTFDSYEDFQDFLAEAANNSGGNYFGFEESLNIAMDDTSGASKTSTPSVPRSDGDSQTNAEGSSDYSETNIQVEGVDEPDIVKTDGEYLYVVANNTVYILKAIPAENAEIISTLHVDENQYIHGLFLDEGTLAVITGSWQVFAMPMIEPAIVKSETSEGTETAEPDISVEHATANTTNSTEDLPEKPLPPQDEEDEDDEGDTDEDDLEPIIEPYIYPYRSVSTTKITLYNIENPTNPTVKKTVEIEGNYFDARMIDGTVYLVATEYTYELHAYVEEKQTIAIPELSIDNESEPIEIDSIYYIDTPEPPTSMTHVFSVTTTGKVSHKTFLLDSSHSMYVSRNNIYLTSTIYNTPTLGLLRAPDNTNEEETTMIHRIQINNGNIDYTYSGEVPGHILNQFSMDEHNGYFRIATTIGWSWWSDDSESTNNVYILDSELNIVGSIEDLAPGEQIYSTRFMGDKAYMVTFKNVDPFFTLDLSDPTNPQALGYLKIPGYSTYLHPYDENHIIGIGKDAIETDDDSLWNDVWYQGLKIALFNVTDFENPTEIDHVIIGDRGTDSNALYDHKAFLFDREKNLLVIPVTLYEIPAEYKTEDEKEVYSYGEYTYDGAYVYTLTTEGFELRGRVTHTDENWTAQDTYRWFYYPWNSFITRSLYINNVLYTISNTMVKLNDLQTLEELNQIELG